MSQAIRSAATASPKRPSIERDEFAAYVDRSWEELFGMDRAQVEAFQLAAAKKRFEELSGTVQVLKAQAEKTGVFRIDELNDVVPLLFHDAVYKSYPLSLIEKNRYGQLTEWLSTLTSVDLSSVDVAGIDGLDSWMDALESQAPLQIYHTSGTSGKMSFFPRSVLERDFYFEALTKQFAPWKSIPGAYLGRNGERMPCVFPTWRYGRHVMQRNIPLFEKYVAPTPDQVYTVTNGTLSADLISLSGRIRLAQAKGELKDMKLSDASRRALKRYLQEQQERPGESSDFLRRMAEELAGKRAYVNCGQYLVYESAAAGLERGLRNLFASNSVGASGGGSKGRGLPANWKEVVSEFTGIRPWGERYGMTEITGPMAKCSEGHFHIPLYQVPYQLDPETGAVLPRRGTVTGRFAFLDLLAQTYWGGFISGDRVTIEWDAQCPCGRKGAFLHADIVRYSEIVTGDDKITCAATIDNTDTALQALINI